MKKSLIARILCVVIAVLLAVAVVVFAFVVPWGYRYVNVSAEESKINIIPRFISNKAEIESFPYSKTEKGTTSKALDNVYYEITIDILFEPTQFTIEIDSNIQTNDHVFLVPIINNTVDYSKQIQLDFTNNIVYSDSFSYRNFIIRINNDNPNTNNIEFNFNIYIYQGTYTKGFGQGYQAGHSNGYNEGLQEGLSTARYGYLNGATYTVTGTQNYTPTNINSSWSLTGTLPNIFVYNTINFQTIGTEIDAYFASPEKQDYQFIDATITINLKTPFVYNSVTTKIVENGLQSIGWTITLVDTNGDKYSISADTHYDNGGYDLQFPINAEGKEITTITATFSGSADLVVGTVQVGRLTYNAGYDDGYNDGYSNGETSGIIVGRQEGEKIGYNSGYQAGYTDGSGVSYSNLNVVSLFLSPVNSFLATPLFGSFSLGTAFSVVLVVLLGAIFIKMFAGG